MTLIVQVFDTATGTRRAISNWFKDCDFTVGGGGQAVFNLTSSGATLTSTSKVDAYINGSMTQPGSTLEYTLDTVGNNINFNETIPQNSWVRIRVYSF